MKKLLLFFLTLGGAAVQAQPYTFTQFQEPYITVSNGTMLSGVEPWDDDDYTIPFGFDFTFRGQEYASAGLNTNGLLDFSNEQKLFAALWADFVDRNYNLSGPSVSPVSYAVEGTPGQRIVKIQFQNAGFYNDTTGQDWINFQVWLYEVDDALEVRVGSSDIADPFTAFDGPGPVVGVLTGSDVAIDYTLLLSGDPGNATAVWWNGFEPIPMLGGVPDSGTVYRFAPEVGICGWFPEIGPGTLLVCPNGSGVLTAAPDSAQYQWYENGEAIAGATNQTLVVDHTDIGGSFTVSVNIDGCIDTSYAASVVELDMPLAVDQFGGTVDPNGVIHACAGNPMILYIASGHNANIQWYHNGTQLPEGNDVYVMAMEPGTYHVVAAMPQCPDLLDTAQAVTVVFDVLTPDVTMTSGVLSTDPVYDAYQWFFNGEEIPGANGPSVAAAQPGAYSVAVMDANGCSGESVPFVITGMDAISEHGLSLHPNPTTDRLVVTGLKNTNAVYDIFDSTGKLAMSGTVAAVVVVKDLAPGLYLFQVQSGGEMFSQSFLKH